MKKLLLHFKLAWYGLLMLCVCLFLVLSAINGSALSEVRVKLNDGQKDYMDKKIPLITKDGEEYPDYRVDYFESGKWHKIGTIHNTSAKDWLQFRISDPPSLTLVQNIRVVEDDLAKDDFLEEVFVEEGMVQGDKFKYEFKTVWSFKAGMSWFASTALGKAIFGAISLVVILVILSTFTI